MDCDLGQGYLLGRPMTPAAFEAWRSSSAASVVRATEGKSVA
jgi:EAL domain-containing protein (putative c-di-GMP-specific phosphodiesterase class I)